jgi:hypothetical protein
MRQDADLEYAELKAFLSFYDDRYLNVGSLPPEKRPTANLEALEKKSMKAASNGLRQAINDIIEMSFHFDREEAAKLDEQLRSRGIVTLSELRRRYSKKYRAIVKRGQIINDTEYYFVRNVLSDPGTKTKAERETLETLIANYEGT